MALSIFTPSCSGMSAQSQALESVSTNIANIQTTGYKATQTMFYTLLGSQPVVRGNQVELSSSHADIDGVGYYNRNLIDSQGLVSTTGNSYDIAISGTGNAFFMVSDGYNNYYTRAGNFEPRVSGDKTYLVTSGGLRVQGFPANEDGTFGANPTDIELISPETIPATPTTEMTITANVPSNDTQASYGLTVYGGGKDDGSTMVMSFNKVEGSNNLWDLGFTIAGGTVTYEPIEVRFDGNGNVLTPKVFDITVNWADGTSQNVHIDISNMTQLGGGNDLVDVQQNGKMSGKYVKSYIDSDGIVKAMYDNGQTYNNGKLALVGFTAPNNLQPVSETLFEAFADAGEATYIGTQGILTAGALEGSTANVEQEFSTMMIVQRAYSLNATAFTTSDEMLQELVNLKT